MAETVKSTLIALFHILGGVLIFQGVINVPKMHDIIVAHPLITISIGIALAIFGDDLVNKFLK